MTISRERREIAKAEKAASEIVDTFTQAIELHPSAPLVDVRDAAFALQKAAAKALQDHAALFDEPRDPDLTPVMTKRDSQHFRAVSRILEEAKAETEK